MRLCFSEAGDFTQRESRQKRLETREFDCACHPFLILPHEVGI
jgi:hypothetical protein